MSSWHLVLESGTHFPIKPTLQVILDPLVQLEYNSTGSPVTHTFGSIATFYQIVLMSYKIQITEER